MQLSPVEILERHGQGLMAAIREGDCVAFVGAGFTAPATGTWRQLLERLARASGDEALERRVARRVGADRPRSVDFEAAAEALRAHFGADRFREELRRALSAPADDCVDRRLRWLRGIPFRAILTVNVDHHLPGAPWGEVAYRSVLRPEQPARWSAERFWDTEAPLGAPVVKLHGDVDRGEIVFSTRDYRHKLYTDLTYLGFVRAVLATTTVLYLGFSFTDAYLNQLRSEILAMVGAGGDKAPTAYAVLDDVDPDDVAHYFEHESIQILGYDAREGHGGFDAYLEALHDRTRPSAVLARATARKRLLWLDPNPANNAWGFRVIEGDDPADARPELVKVGTVDEALAALAARPFDLVISHWGHELAVREGRRVAAAERLLAEIPPAHRAPVIVFGGEAHGAANRPRALRLGAFELTWEWPRLFEAIVRAIG